MPRKRTTTPEDYDKPFPSRLREVMKERGLTQQDIADVLGKTRQAVGYYMDGSSSPDLDTIVKLAVFFGVSTDYLLGVTNIRTSDPDTRAICGKLGLSETVVKWLEERLAVEGPFRYAPFDSGINAFLEHPRAFDFFKTLAEADAVSKSIADAWGKLTPAQRIESDRDYRFNLFLLKELAGEIIDELSGKTRLADKWKEGASSGNDNQT